MGTTALKFMTRVLRTVLKGPLLRTLETRKEPRFSTRDGIKARMKCSRPTTLTSIDVLDISKNGMAFVVQDGRIEVGDTVEIILDSDVNARTIQKGKVLSNQILRQGGGVGMGSAVHRFSIQFHRELESNILENIKTMRLNTAV